VTAGAAVCKALTLDLLREVSKQPGKRHRKSGRLINYFHVQRSADTSQTPCKSVRVNDAIMAIVPKGSLGVDGDWGGSCLEDQIQGCRAETSGSPRVTKVLAYTNHAWTDFWACCTQVWYPAIRSKE